MNICIMAVGMILCLTIPGKLMGAFTENPQDCSGGNHGTAYHLLRIHFVCSIGYSLRRTGGTGKGIPSLLISLSSYVVLIIPLAFIFSRFWGAVGVWHAFWVAEASTAVFAALIYRHSVKE